MGPTPIHVLKGHLTGDGPLDTAVSRAILRRVDAGELPETIQVGTPHHIVAFGKHDTLQPGFIEAVTVARDHGYDPSIRIAGGRAVTFSPSILRFAWTVPEPEPAPTMHARFRILAEAVVGVLAAIDVDAEIGELPNEFCAGAYSVHLTDGGKVMGVGQRLGRRAAQVGGMIVLEDAEAINEVLVPIYAALGIPLDPRRTGAVGDAVHADASTLADDLVGRLTGGRPSVVTGPDAATLRLAAALRPDHDPATRDPR